MGMDYKYSGSSSYPRFDRELCEIAKIFGGIETEHLRERKETENEHPFGYWFGFLSSDDSKLPKFIFPDGTNNILVKWFNNIYYEFTTEETKIIWEYISKYPEIENISDQIWNELKELVEYNEGWEIS